jgi:hypothetical protein
MRDDSRSADPLQPVSLVQLRGLRLGRCARRILLLAPTPWDEPLVVLPERAGRAPAESHRRAMRRLAESGLIELTWKSALVETSRPRRSPRVRWDQAAGGYRDLDLGAERVERVVERRAVRLTPLGQTLVDRLRPCLQNGRRIRWDAVIGLASGADSRDD